MPGESNLEQLLQTMAPVVHPETFVYCTFSSFSLPCGLEPLSTVRESEGLTAIVPLSQARALDLDFQFESAMITLSVHSSLSAVGLLARVCGALAASGIPCNVVSGFYHDHLFVPPDELPAALQALERLAVKTPGE